MKFIENDLGNRAQGIHKTAREVRLTGSIVYQKKYTVPEASKLLGISETSLRGIIARGEIPVIRIQKAKILILEQDLEEFIKSKYGVLKVVNL